MDNIQSERFKLLVQLRALRGETFDDIEIFSSNGSTNSKQTSSKQIQSELISIKHQNKILEIEFEMKKKCAEFKKKALEQISEQISNQKEEKVEKIQEIKEMNDLPKEKQKIAIQKFVEDLKKKLEILTKNKEIMVENEKKMNEQFNKNHSEVEKLNEQFKVISK